MKTYLKQKDEWLVALFYLLVTVVYGSQIPLIRRTTISPVNSTFIPMVICVGMGILTLIQAYVALKKTRQDKSLPEMADTTDEDRPDHRRALLTLAAALLFVAVLKPLGFVVSSVIYLELQMCIMAPPEQRKPLRFLIISIIAVIIIYAVFHWLLRLMLPTGILTGIL